MSVSFRVAGTWAELIADGSVAIPATPQAGDRMYLFAGWKDFSVTAQVTSPSGWTELVEFADGAISAGNGTGSVKVACWYRDWQSGDTDPTIDFSAAPDNAAAVIMVMRKDADDVWLTPVAVTAAMTNWTTSSQIVSASSTAAVPSGGVVMGLIRLRDDSAVMTRPASGIDDSAAAVTWNGDYVESPVTHHSTTTGFDGATDLGYRLVTTGATATLRMTGTISAAETGAALWVVQGVSVQVTPTTATLTSSQFAPSLKLAITPASASLTSTSFAPQLREVITPAQANLSVTGFAPSLNLIVTPPSATLNLTSFAPQLREVLTPANAALSVSSFAPSLNTTITPDAALLLMTSFAPDVTQNTLIMIPVASLVITTSRPHVLPFKLIYLDPGGDATQTVGHFNTDVGSTGLVTYDSTVQVVGVGSYKFNSDDGSQSVCASVNGIMGESRRVSTYFMYDSVPNAATVVTKFVGAGGATYSGDGFEDIGGGPNVNNNLDVDDGAYAFATPPKNAGQGAVFGALGFDTAGVGIPIGAKIDSVKIIYERKYDVNTSIGISRVKWRIDGVEGPDHDNTAQPLTDTVVEVDVTGDREWTREVLTNASFEVIAEARRGDTDTAHTQSWDYLKVQVQWHTDTIISVRSDVDANGFQIGVAPRGDGVVLRLIDSDGTFYFGVTELLPDVQHRISFAYVQTGSMAEVNVFVNGVPELSVVDVAVGGTPMANLRYGWVDSPGASHLCWFDQLAIDAGDDLQDIGNILMTAKLPASVNDNGWNTTAGTGAVNERPLSETNHRRHTFPTEARQSYTLQAASVGDVDVSGESLVGYMAWLWWKLQSNDFDQLFFTVNGVDIESGALFVTTPSLFTYGVSSTTYPSHAAAIGMLYQGESDPFIYECGIVQAYLGPGDDPLFPLQLLQEDTSASVSDNMGGLPPAEYELRNDIPEVAGTVITTTVYSRTAEGEVPQQQAIIESSGGGEVGIVTVSPGIEVSVNIDVAGADAEVGLRRVDEIVV